jgi:hypothetical protein
LPRKLMDELHLGDLASLMVYQPSDRVVGGPAVKH